MSLANTWATANSNGDAWLDDPEVLRFIEQMARDHQFSPHALQQQFSRIHPNPRVLQLVAPPSAPEKRSWTRYRARFLDKNRIKWGVEFWRKHQEYLTAAEHQYGVPAEIIVAILGVETVYGRNTGTFGVMESLATLAFHYPRRAAFFQTELAQFLLLAREQNLDPLSVRGSYAGALGLPQFMPGSQRRYAVDFDHDGAIDLLKSPADAIGSVAHFLEKHGWQRGEPIAIQASLPVSSAGLQIHLDAGIYPSISLTQLRQEGLIFTAGEEAKVAVIELSTPGSASELWLGYNNFYAITRYNRSSFYAMSVFLLAENLRRQKHS